MRLVTPDNALYQVPADIAHKRITDNTTLAAKGNLAANQLVSAEVIRTNNPMSVRKVLWIIQMRYSRSFLVTLWIQGYLTYKNPPPSRTLL